MQFCPSAQKWGIRTWKGSEKGNSGKPDAIKKETKKTQTNKTNLTKTPKPTTTTNHQAHKHSLIIYHIRTRTGMQRVSRDWCLPLSANATKSCRAKPQEGATHRPKQRHAVLCTAGSASAELLPPGCGTLPKLYIGSRGDWESSQKSTKNGCKQRHRIQLMGFLKWLEEASLHTYLILASPQASTSGHCWGRAYWAR